MNSPKQKLVSFYQKNKRMPSYAEVATLFNYKSKNAATKLIQKCVDDGFVSKDKTGKIIPGKSFFELRLLGSVKAGFPSPAEEELIDTLSLDDYLIGNREATFMLTVKGDSMIEACIADGDLIIVERRDMFNNNDIVVAQVEDGYTVKYFKKRGTTFWLEPANKDFQNIRPTEESPIKIIAVVTAVIRKM